MSELIGLGAMSATRMVRFQQKHQWKPRCWWTGKPPGLLILKFCSFYQGAEAAATTGIRNVSYACSVNSLATVLNRGCMSNGIIMNVAFTAPMYVAVTSLAFPQAPR